MNDTSKRFEDWEEVDCNECARYWDSSCDGVKPSENGSRKPCNSFLATRSVVIPAQIERLQKAVKGLVWAVCFMAASILCHYLGCMFGW